ncbi:MAG: hypothetical protein KGR98_02840, partial [Verrucomicrobia bacterium]|nr:hypothetical protein [Verrucomicrobiota bacterium]
MKTRILFVAGVMVVLAIITAQVLISRHSSIRKFEPPRTELTKPTVPTAAAIIKVPAPEKTPLEAITSSRQDAPAASATSTKVPTGTPLQTETANAEKPIMYNGYPVEDPVARVALYSVGAGDPEANAYWENAIFDPTLPAAERKDLIEDLNETGMADPRHPGPSDLPLILSRIQLI